VVHLTSNTEPRGGRRNGSAGSGRLERVSPARLVMLVAAITAVGLLLRLPSFNDSLFGDELSTYFIVTGHSVGHIIYLLQGHSVDLNPPLFFLLVWVVERFGDGAHALRLVSLLAGTAAIPLTYLLGLWTVGRRAAMVGAALMALSPFLIFYSTEARAYALLLLLMLVCTLCLLRAVATRRVRYWVGYAVFSCAAVYTHYIAVFYLGTLFVWAFLARPEARRALIAANLAAAVAYVPWLPTLLKDTRSPGNQVIGFLEPFDLHLVASYLARWSIGHPLLGVVTLPGLAAIVIAVLGVVAGLAGFAPRPRHAHGKRALPQVSSGTVLVVVLAVVPPAAIALYSAIGHSVWEVRNMIAGWPALALSLGALLTSGRGLLRVAAVGLVIAAYALGGAQMLEPSNQRPDYDAVVTFIDRVSSQGDPVIDLPGPTPGPLTDLDGALDQASQSPRGRHPVLRLGYPPLSALLRSRPYAPVPATSAATVIRQAAALGRGGTLFVIALQQQTALLDFLLKPLPTSFRRIETRTFTGLAPVSVYVFRDSRGPPGD
jgi:mannosyltransferase